MDVGLVNMHVHLCGSGKPVSAGNAGDLMRRLDNAPGRAIVRRVLAGSARQQLASGVTTVRGAGDPLFGDLAVRDAIESGRLEGPRLVAPGTGITVPGGHGAGLFAQVANAPEEAAAMVRDLFARKADVIKLFITGGVFDATEPGEPGVVRMLSRSPAPPAPRPTSWGFPSWRTWSPPRACARRFSPAWTPWSTGPR